MTTTVTSILRDGVTAAGIYPTFAAWFAALPANLVTADEIHILNVEAKSGGYTGITLDTTGITTDATHYIRIQPAAGHRHAGVWDTAKAMFHIPNNNAAPWVMATNYFYMDGMQLSHIGNTVLTNTITVAGQSSDTNRTEFTRNLIKSAPSGDSGYLNFFYINSAVIERSKLYLGANIFIDVFNTNYPAATSIKCVNFVAGRVWAHNNTFINCANAFTGGSTQEKYSLKNNLVAGYQYLAGRVDYNVSIASITAESTNNASSDATAVGTNAKLNQTFTFTGAGDYHLLPGDTVALGQGADLSGDADFPVTTDIDGNTFSAPWPIGADTVASVSGSISITSPAMGRIYQHAANIANITVSGTYTGSVVALKARLVLFGTSTVVSGFDWATVVASPSGNAFSFTLTGVPKGAGWYSVEVQDTVTPAITATVGKVGVGELVCVAGQSNGNRLLTVGSGSVSDLLRCFGNEFTGWQLPTTAGPAAMGAAAATAYGCPVGIINTSIDGTSIAGWGGGNFTSAKAIIDSVGGKIASLIWVQGEADWNSISYATYLSGLGTVLDTNFRGQLGIAALPVFVVALGSYPGGNGTDTTTYDQIKKAQYDYAAGNANTYIVDRIDCTIGDTVHLDGAGATKLGNRLIQALKKQLGIFTEYRGPSVSSVNKINATTYNVVVTQHLGTDLTPATEITGFTAIDSGAGDAAIAVTSALRQSATVIQIVLASAPVGLPKISYATGYLPVITAMARDNSALTLPLEWAYQITAAEKTASINLVNASNAAQASLTGLKWAWFDEITPNLFNAPTDKGTGEVTDGSGVLTVVIGNSAKASGQVGWLIVTNSDGNPATVHKAFSGPVTVA